MPGFSGFDISGSRTSAEYPWHATHTVVDEVSDKAIELYAYLMLSIYHSNNGGHEEAIEFVRRAMDRAHRRGNMRRLLEKLEEIIKDWPPEPRPAHLTE